MDNNDIDVLQRAVAILCRAADDKEADATLVIGREDGHALVLIKATEDDPEAAASAAGMMIQQVREQEKEIPAPAPADQPIH